MNANGRMLCRQQDGRPRPVRSFVVASAVFGEDVDVRRWLMDSAGCFGRGYTGGRRVERKMKEFVLQLPGDPGRTPAEPPGADSLGEAWEAATKPEMG